MYGILNDALISEKKRVISRDKVRDMSQKYWLCSNERLVRELGYKPSYDLERGMDETVDWYRRNGFIPLEKTTDLNR
jgi:UDP-glucose 4-epimerase